MNFKTKSDGGYFMLTFSSNLSYLSLWSNANVQAKPSESYA